jgi:hypothetical protein
LSAVAHIDEYKTGRFYTDEYRGEMSWNGYENNVLLRNEGPGEGGTPRFIDVAMALGADDQRDSRGVAIADFDNDGDLDVAVNHNPGDNDDLSRRQATLLRNDIGHHRAWLAVELEGRQSNRDAVGAVVLLKTGDLLQTRQVTAGSGYASQQSRRLYFGLGEATTVDELSVIWPSGERWRFDQLPVRRMLRIVEGEEPEWLPLPTP